MSASPAKSPCRPAADFIKTSTGKVSPAATMPVTLVMLEAIRDYFFATGIRIGMKPAGGIRNVQTSARLSGDGEGNAWRRLADARSCSASARARSSTTCSCKSPKPWMEITKARIIFHCHEIKIETRKTFSKAFCHDNFITVNSSIARTQIKFRRQMELRARAGRFKELRHRAAA